jgi:hypothetical protein
LLNELFARISADTVAINKIMLLEVSRRMN